MDLNTDFLLFDILTEQVDPNLRQKQEAELKMLKDRQTKEKENTIDPVILQSIRKKHDEELKILKQTQSSQQESIKQERETNPLEKVQQALMFQQMGQQLSQGASQIGMGLSWARDKAISHGPGLIGKAKSLVGT